MRLLVITQKVDKEDQVLGFFHKWLEKLAERFEKIYVICLQKGDYNLPDNVEVFSLGKEKIVASSWQPVARIKYFLNFHKHVWNLKKDYDVVFVHMNQEYILMGGVFWKMLGKKIYFWRNHPQGSLLTRIAVWFSDKVFYTSSGSYTAKFKKAIKMPAGVDVESFKPQTANRKKNSILSLGRISPIKNIHTLVEALKILDEKKINFEADIYGDPLPKDEKYYGSLKTQVQNLDLASKVKFHPGVSNYKTPEIYNTHDIFVNLTPSGSLDKTIFEAALCGCITAVCPGASPEAVAQKLEYWLKAGEDEKNNEKKKLALDALENHSLGALIDKLLIYLNDE